MTYYCLGYDNAGFLIHVTNGTKECCQTTAKQIRPHYKSVRIVDEIRGSMLIEADKEKRIIESKRMKEAMAI